MSLSKYYNNDDTVSVSDKFDFSFQMRYIDLCGGNPYLTKEVDPKIQDKYGNSYIMQFQIKEIDSTSIGIAFGLKIIMPNKFSNTSISYIVFMGIPGTDTRAYRCVGKRYQYDPLISVPYSLDETGVQISCATIEQSYLGTGEYAGSVKILVSVDPFEIKYKKEYMINKIQEKLLSDEMEPIIATLQSEIENMKKTQNTIEESIKNIDDEKKKTLDEKEDLKIKVFDPLNKRFNIINDVNGRFKLRKRSLLEHMIQIREKINENNIHEFLKNVEQLNFNDFTLIEKKILLNKLSQLLIKVYKRINDEQNCGICMDRRPNCVLQPCSHAFCSSCIEENSATSKTCPKCIEPYVSREILDV